MDWLLLLLTVFNVISMYTAFCPRRFANNKVTPMLVFSFALLATELSWIWLPFQALLALLLVGLGALDSSLGRFSMLVLAVSWLGLVWSIAQGFLSAREVERALIEGLGEDYRSVIPAAINECLRKTVRFADWSKPRNFDQPGIEVLRDIPYAARGKRSRLDVYRPRTLPAEGCPVLLQIHGGAWVVGDKKHQALPLMTQLAARGWICVAINYRLSPSVSFPTHLYDCKAALAWIREQGFEYGMNPAFVAVTGGSAGGHLAALMGLTENRAELQPDFPNGDTSIQACVPIYGVYDFLARHAGEVASKGLIGWLEENVMHCSPEENSALWELASPMTQIHGAAPPFMIVHGRRDSLALVDGARHFQQDLRAVSENPVVYLELAGAEHGFEMMHSPRAEHFVDGVHRFLEWARAKHATTE